ncbi:MAG: ABC transporter substrate-binding protein [Myxococcota bacterium]
MASPRVVSLLPSTTEIVCALGLRDTLVGRSHECDFPKGVEALPPLTEPKLDADAPSRVIDDRVRELVGEGLSVYRVDADRLRELAPDVILTQTHCEVCAASVGDVEAALQDWVGGRPEIVALQPNTLADVWDDVGRAAAALGAASAGDALRARLTDRVTELGERAAGGASRPRVATIEWIDPWMAAGNWVPELVSIAGGEELFGSAGSHSPWLELDALRGADPDTLVVMPCGFGLERTRSEFAPAAGALASLRAVREGRVALTDGHQYFNRPGPRLVESLEILCEILQPERFPARHEGAGWEWLDGRLPGEAGRREG